MLLDLDGFLAANIQRLVELRRLIHSHPELGMREYKTTELVVRTLEAAGLKPRTMPRGTGVICDIGKEERPIVALRAELDALPVHDRKNVSYASSVTGLSHACGHDAHTAMLLGVGLVLSQTATTLPGKVRLLFQPAEELLQGGSTEVIAAGGLEGVSDIFALHVDPRTEVGKVGVRVGPITAAYDEIGIQLSGPGGHSSRPHVTPDLVYVMGKIIVGIPGSLSRLVDPTAALTVTFGSVHGGMAPNVIPSTVTAQGTVRTLSRRAWEAAPTLLRELVDAAVSPYRVELDYSYRRGSPPVVNDEAATALMSRAVRETLGDEALTVAPESLGGEDFAWFLEKVPGCLGRLGARIPGTQFDLHSAVFDVDERALPLGVRVLVGTALSALQHHGRR